MPAPRDLPPAAVSATTAAAAVCFRDNNWNHYRAGRASICGGSACAVGSGRTWAFVRRNGPEKQTGPSYYVIGTCP